MHPARPVSRRKKVYTTDTIRGASIVITEAGSALAGRGWVAVEYKRRTGRALP